MLCLSSYPTIPSKVGCDKIRPIIRQFFWVKIGNGQNTFAWHDNWCTYSPFYEKLSPRDITSAGLMVDTKVSNIILNGTWNWPVEWHDRFPSTGFPPINANKKDVMLWKDRNGNLKEFSVNVVWEELRPRNSIVDWSDLVWFSYCIPRHAFILWLAFRKRLKTQDVLLQWHVNPNVDMLCPFCKFQPDSHSHLFFECDYSMQVWKRVCIKAGLHTRPSDWNMILNRLLPRARRKSMKNVLDKLLLAASVYFLWQERNARLFMNISRTVDGVAEIILSTIRLKLLTFRYKRSANVERFLAAWDLPMLLAESN